MKRKYKMWNGGTIYLSFPTIFKRYSCSNPDGPSPAELGLRRCCVRDRNPDITGLYEPVLLPPLIQGYHQLYFKHNL